MAAITSLKTGVWSDTTVWSTGTVPVDGDKVTIVASHVVTVDGTVACGDDTQTAVNINGTLKASRTTSTQITFKGMVTINAGGTWDWGTSASPIPSTYTAKVLLNNSAALSAGKYGLYAADNSYFFSYGSVRTTNTYLTSSAASAQAVIVVNDATGWAAGDIVVIGTTDTDTDGSHCEVRTILSVSGTSITLTSNLTYTHLANGRVGNMTKNVVYDSASTSNGGYVRLDWNATNTTNAREVRHSLFQNMSYDRIVNTIYGGVYISPGTSSTTVTPWIAFDNNVNYLQQTGAQGGFSIFTGYRPFSMTNCAVYNANISIAVCTNNGCAATIDGLVVYRASLGMSSGYSQGGQGIYVTNSYFQGCNNTALYLSNNVYHSFTNCYIDSSVTGHFSNASVADYKSCYFGKLTANSTITNMFSVTNNSLGTITLTDCQFGTNYTRWLVNSTFANPAYKLIIANKNVDPSVQEIYTSTGNFYRDNSFYKLGSTSLRCEPASATSPATFSLQIIAPTGKPVVVSGYLYYDANYTGTNYPSATLSGLGITPSTYTMSGGSAKWEQFNVQATQNTGTDGILTLTFSFQSAAGKAWASGISAPPYVAVNTGEFGYWSSGLPVGLIIANNVTAYDVWNIQTSQVANSGTMGLKLVQGSTKGDIAALD